MGYYFITYQATNKQGSVSIWNQVIDQSPMKFIKYMQDMEEKGKNTYHNFIVINTCEISETDFITYDGYF